MLNDAWLDELVWLDLVLRGDEKATQGAIYRSQQLRLDALGEDAIADWVVQLHHRARLFQRILAPEEEPVAVIRTALGRLDRWGSTVVHPIALHVLEAHEGGAVSGGEVARALRVVESFQVRRMLAGIPTNNLNRIRMSLVKDLGERIPTAEAVTEAALSGPRSASLPIASSVNRFWSTPSTSRVGGINGGTFSGRSKRTSGTPSRSTSTSRADGRGHPVRRVVARRSGAAHVSRRTRRAPLGRSRESTGRDGSRCTNTPAKPSRRAPKPLAEPARPTIPGPRVRDLRLATGSTAVLGERRLETSKPRSVGSCPRLGWRRSWP